MIDHFHDEKDPLVSRAGRVNLNDIRVIHPCRHTCLFFELCRRSGMCAQILAQNLQGHETIVTRVLRFIDGTHAADPERFEENEIVEHRLDSKFFAALRARDRSERLAPGNADGSVARRTTLFGNFGSVRHWDRNMVGASRGKHQRVEML